MKFQVIDTKTDKSHGVYDTLNEAQGCVAYDHLSHYEIWRGVIDPNAPEESMDEEDFWSQTRVQSCNPYEGDDRAKQGLGEPCQSETII